jgi:hypothetical protein
VAPVPICGVCLIQPAGKRSYSCRFCCAEKEKVACCDTCFETWRSSKAICQKPSCLPHATEVLKERAAATEAERERKQQEAKARKEATEKQITEARQELSKQTQEDLQKAETQFRDHETFRLGCLSALGSSTPSLTVQTLVNACKAAQWAARWIPEANADQLLEIFLFAFQRGSRVVLGGSRARSFFVTQRGKPYRPGEVPYKGLATGRPSDLDVGFGGLHAGQVAALYQKVGATLNPGWLPIEESAIIPGNTIGGKEIESPEEFFQRSGERSDADPKRVQEGITHYYPSGSISFHPDGRIQESPPF